MANANVMGYWADSFCRAPAACRGLPGFLAGVDSSGFISILTWMTVAGFFLTVAYRIGISWVSVEAVSRIYDETTLRTSRLPMSFFDTNPAGRVMTRFSSDYNNVFRIFGGPLAEFLGLVFDLIAMSILITIASPLFLPFWAMLALLNYCVYRYFLPSLRHARRETARTRSPGIAHFAESAQGAATIRAFGKQKSFEDRFARLNDRYLMERQKAANVFSRFSISMGLMTSMMFLITGLSGAWMIRQGLTSVGAIGVAFAYLGLSTHVLHSFFDWLGQFEEAMTGLERMNEYLRLPLESGAKLPSDAEFETGHPKHSSAFKPIRNRDGMGASVEIEDLWMRYREDLPQVLEGVSLRIEPGERLAIVGKTGSGKTSLVQALFQLYAVERGRIRIAGHEALSEGGTDLEAYRSLLSYITQEPALFIGSLRDNLVPPGTPELGDRDLVQALRRVQFLNPEAKDEEYLYWLEYQVEERGRNLSAGERQLICMARCLLQDSPVIILDEATSAVDPRSEEMLTRATEEFFSGKTQIIIAHRLSTVRSCDRVLWLKQGKVFRLGKPDEVLREFEASELNA